jgi:hypothetical protein
MDVRRTLAHGSSCGLDLRATVPNAPRDVKWRAIGNRRAADAPALELSAFDRMSFGPPAEHPAREIGDFIEPGAL